MKASPLLKAFSKRQFVSMIFPASCVGCGLELKQSAIDDTLIDETLVDDFTHPGFASIQSADPLNIVQPDDNDSNRDSTLSFRGGHSFQRWQHAHWCEPCWRALKPQSKSRCPRCGASLLHPNPLAPQCAHCHGYDLRFDRAWAVGNYQGLLQELVIRTKNQHDESLAIQLGTLLGYDLLMHGWIAFDRLMPVPCHWLRKLKRGFQAADILADSVSQLIGVPKHTKMVRSVRGTMKQGTLSITARQANVRNAFKLCPQADVRGKKILIIDDVMTSGATTSEIARVLKRGGAQEVCVSVVARGAGVS